MITGCFLPDGRMVLSCSIPSSVRFINEDGVELFQIGKDKTGAGTYDAVYIKNDFSVAVSSKRCITIIDIENKEVMTTISMETDIYGMAVRGRTIYYCTRNKGIQMLNLSDKSVSHIINSKMPRVYYVATFGDKLYYTDCHTDTVTCCELHGTTQWQFKDDRTVHSLVGISVDNDGNVYVIGFTSDNVVVISPDGQRHRELLSVKDGLSVLDNDKSKNRLIVVNKSRTAFLFDVTKRE